MYVANHGIELHLKWSRILMSHFGVNVHFTTLRHVGQIDLWLADRVHSIVDEVHSSVDSW
jgi:hypothetical protein